MSSAGAGGYTMGGAASVAQAGASPLAGGSLAIGGGPAAAPSGGAGSGSGGGGTPSGGSGGVSLSGNAGQGPMKNGCGSELVCDDFESYAPGKAPSGSWSAEGGDAVQVDTGKAFSGAQSVHFKIPADPARMMMTRNNMPPIPGNNMFGRVMLYLTTTPVVPNQQWVHFNLIRADGALPDGSRGHYAWGAIYGKVFENYDPHDCYKISNTRFPDKRWACFQWQFDGSKVSGSGANEVRKNQIRIWLDGTLLNDASVDGIGDGCPDKTHTPWVAGTFDALNVGWEHYQKAAEDNDLWLDDLAVDDHPIACPSGSASVP